jgi:hypothetical protein
MIVIALVALNISAISATVDARPSRPRLGVGFGNGRGFTFYDLDGSVMTGKGNAETGYHSTRMIRPPRPPAAVTWMPALAGVTISILALVLALRVPRSWRVRAPALVVLGVLAGVSLYGWRILYDDGGPIHRLHLDMPKEDVERLVGPPDPKGSNESTWLIAPRGSLRYLSLEFDENDRLIVFKPGTHERGGHPAWRAWHHDRSSWSFWRIANP